MAQTTQICPCCNQTIRKPRAQSTVASTVAPVDKATLTDAELFAYLKKIGLREDCRFFLKHAPNLPTDLRAEGEALLAYLETHAGTQTDRKRLHSIQDRAAALRYQAERERKARPVVITAPVVQRSHKGTRKLYALYRRSTPTPAAVPVSA